MKEVKQFIKEEIKKGRGEAIRQNPDLARRLAQDPQLHSTYFWLKMAEQISRTWRRKATIYLVAGVKTGASLVTDAWHSLLKPHPSDPGSE